jgi:hypothetical protein
MSKSKLVSVLLVVCVCAITTQGFAKTQYPWFVDATHVREAWKLAGTHSRGLGVRVLHLRNIKCINNLAQKSIKLVKNVVFIP